MTIVGKIKAGVLAIAVLIGGGIIMDGYGTVSPGYYHMVFNPLTGSVSPKMTEGVYFRVPLLNQTVPYKRVFTASFDVDDNGSTRDLDPIPVQFADTYSAAIPATFRFKLTSDPEKMKKLHREFRNFDNLVDSLITKNAKNVTVVTATQYTGEVFFQGGLNSFKNKLEDQLQNGLYQTERQQVKINVSGNAAVSVDNENANKVEKQVQLVWQNVILTDAKTGAPLRLRNPLADYGVTVTQVTIDKPSPETRLSQLLTAKKELVAKRITATQKIITAKAEASAAAQEMEIEKQQAIQKAQKEKDLAVIAEKQKVDIERQQAELQLVRKDKQLRMAKADEAIQEAAARAAIHQANAIKATGLAEAEVDKAKLAAKQSASDIYMAEMQRDIAMVMYPALKDIKIDMPDFYVAGQGPNHKAPTSLEMMATIQTLRTLPQAGK